MLFLEIFFCFPKRLVIPAEWRAAIAADKACCVVAVLLITQSLHHRQLDESLRAAHESATVI